MRLKGGVLCNCHGENSCKMLHAKTQDNVTCRNQPRSVKSFTRIAEKACFRTNFSRPRWVGGGNIPAPTHAERGDPLSRGLGRGAALGHMRRSTCNVALAAIAFRLCVPKTSINTLRLSDQSGSWCQILRWR